jgi:hypothetical protein
VWSTERGIDVGTDKSFIQALKDRGWTFKRTMTGGGFEDVVLKGEVRRPPRRMRHEGL